MARQPVTSPGRSEHVSGSLLVSSEVTNDDAPNGRWTSEGVSFRADPCTNSGYVTFCGPEEGDDDKSIDNPGRLLTFDSFFFWEGDRCTNVTLQREMLEARLEIKLRRTTSNKIEARFEETVLAANGGTGLVATTIAGPLGVVEAVYALVDGLNDSLVGDRGVIHVPQQFVVFLDFYGLITRPGGNRLQLANSDHEVVAGTGYVGLGPAATDGGDPLTPAEGSLYIYATSPVGVRVSSIETTASLNRDNNQYEVRAERAGVAYFDRCAHYAVNVCLPDPGPACAAVS